MSIIDALRARFASSPEPIPSTASKDPPPPPPQPLPEVPTSPSSQTLLDLVASLPPDEQAYVMAKLVLMRKKT